MLLGRFSLSVTSVLLCAVSLLPARSAAAQECPGGFVDTLVVAQGSGCAGMCGADCWMLGVGLDLTAPAMNIFFDVEAGLTKKAKSDALTACESDLTSQWIAQAVRCSEICSAGKPPCAAQLTPCSWSPCEANCESATVLCDPAAWFFESLGGDYPNRVKCEASGSAVVSCTCLPASALAFKSGVENS
jgi:hypothetical protein